MIREALGLIISGERIMDLRELVETRTVSALPVGGRYRLIDFPLSNMINSGIHNVGVVTSMNYHSLMNHLGSGKSWGLSRKSEGLYILTPYANSETQGLYRGGVDALRSSMDFIRRAKQSYCVITGAHTLFNSTFNEMMRFHAKSDADITILYNKLADERYTGERFEDVRFKIDKSGRIVEMEIDSAKPRFDNLNMDTYIIRKDILINLVEECAARGKYHFVDDLIRDNLERLKVMGYQHNGYVGRMHSVAAYFRLNMDLLDPNIQQELFHGEGRILTRVKDEVPARYIGDSKASNCIVANGCIIEGNVENSVLFRGVYIGRGASVKNSIILPNTEVYENSELEYVVIDRDVNIRPRTRLIGSEGFPTVIRKGVTV